MDPITLSVLGAGLVMKSYGQVKANLDQAKAEQANAAWYREQAFFAQETGRRAQEIFDRETDILAGDQLSGFAKSGDIDNATLFMSGEALTRQKESNAIKLEADMNVRLAMMRADQSDKTAKALKNPLTNAMMVGGNIGTSLGSIL